MNYFKYYIFPVLFLIVQSVEGQARICANSISHHPIDTCLLQTSDSLINIGIDTILVYRYWPEKNGFNGYGKAIWLNNGIYYQKNWRFNNNKNQYGITNSGITKLNNDSIINFFFEEELEDVKNNPEEQLLQMSHDGEHFVQLNYNQEKYCFIIEGLKVEANPENKRSIWIRLLADEDFDSKKIDVIKIGRNKYKKRNKIFRKRKLKVFDN